MFEKIKSLVNQMVENWNRSSKKQKKTFFIVTGMIFGALLIGITVASVGIANQQFPRAKKDTPPVGEPVTGAKPSLFGSPSVTVPDDDVVSRSIAGSFVVMDSSVEGDSCYETGTAQTYCFRSETYTYDGEGVESLSLRFPEEWVVTNVRISGTPTCNIGSFGSFTWNVGPTPNEVTLSHYRQQEDTDHCVATYCVDVAPGYATNPALVSWKFQGDNFANQPHTICSYDGFYTCDQAALPPASISACRWKQIASDPTARMDNVLASHNGKIYSITGYGDPGVSYYLPATKEWTTIPSSAPDFGSNLARSGCQIEEKVYIYGDTYTPGFSGLWSYNIDTNTWMQELPAGIPPAAGGFYAPAWVADSEAGLCYLTGGATGPEGTALKSVSVYDARANRWLNPLTAFTTPRNFHAAFLFERPSDEQRLLCVAGGIDDTHAALKSTQCYNFTYETWGAENSDVRRLPDYWWGMGYTQIISEFTGEQLWLVGGVIAGDISDQTWFYDVPQNQWVTAGPLETGPIYRTGASNLWGIIYHVGGSVGEFNITGRSDRCIVDFYNIFPLIYR